MPTVDELKSFCRPSTNVDQEGSGGFSIGQPRVTFFSVVSADFIEPGLLQERAWDPD